jgi:AraC family transcriptional regulator
MLSSDLQKRLFGVIYQAERDPAADLSIASMAKRAGLSPYYFQRAFRSLTGESVKQYTLRVRLQRAAFILKWSNASVIQVALDAGFETHAGFTKAFTRAYGKSPTAFREDAKTVPYVHYLNSPQPLVETATLRASQLIVRIEEWPTLAIASKRYIGHTLGMVGVWPSLTRWARKHELMTDDATCLGLHYDDWDPRIEHKYRYDAAIVVPDGFDDRHVTISEILGGQVAMLEFEGSLHQLDRAWWRFVNEWLPVSGYQVRTEFVFDRYQASDITGGRFRRILRTLAGIGATLCVPVEKISKVATV